VGRVHRPTAAELALHEPLPRSCPDLALSITNFPHPDLRL
jgi:hypothetical protein